MIVTDLDGTVLGSDGRISDRTAAALRRAQEQGVLIVPATGRPTWWLDPLQDIAFDGTAICLNGAAIYDVKAEEITTHSLINPRQMREFVAALADQLPGVAVAVERVGSTEPACWAEPAYQHPWPDGVFPLMQRAELLSVPALKLLVRHGTDSSALAEAIGTLSTPLSVTYSTDNGMIEVAAPGVNKGSAVAAVAAHHQVAQQDVIAFGDMPNDCEMLAWAGQSFAMANAHPLALAAATDRTGSNDADGVAQVLERWF